MLKTALSSLKMTAILCRAIVIMLMTCAVAGNTVMFDNATLLPSVLAAPLKLANRGVTYRSVIHEPPVQIQVLLVGRIHDFKKWA